MITICVHANLSSVWGGIEDEDFLSELVERKGRLKQSLKQIDDDLLINLHPLLEELKEWIEEELEERDQ